MALRGCLLPLVCCVLVPAVSAAQSPDTASSVPLKAMGHEPAWTLDIGSEHLTFITDTGATRIVLPVSAPTRVEGGRRYEARGDAHTLTATVLDRVCVDPMSGLPRPHTVEVTVDGRKLTGCAGDAAPLLRGAWEGDAVGG